MKNTYQIDPVHSSVQFKIRHLMVSNVRGNFSGISGTVQYDPGNPATTNIEAVIDVNTINTNDAQRDGHLKSPDFFDVAQYPSMRFKSKRVEKTGEGRFKITGDLTIHGVTKEVALEVEEVSNEANDPWGNTRIGVAAASKLKRSEFGLTWNAALEAGGFMVGDEVRIEFDLEFIKAKSAAA